MKFTTRGFLCVAIAWILIVCYSIFLVTAIEGIVALSEELRPIIIFLYGLAVTSFLGGSQVPAVFLRKRSFVIQFAFSAGFGLILLVIGHNEIIFEGVRYMPREIFSRNPIIALEYLSIPYLAMIILDPYLREHLCAFSWRKLGQFFKGTFLRPRRTFEKVLFLRSISFSLISILLVSVVWMARSVAFSFLTNFVPARWHFVSILKIRESLGVFLELFGDDVHWMSIALIIPTVLLSCGIVSVLVSMVAHQLGGKGSYSTSASLLGFAFLPSLMIIVVDLLDFGFYQVGKLPVLDAIFFISSLFIPLVFWPLILATLAVQTSEKLPLRSASLTAIIAFLPLFLLLTVVFL